jgi:hypothetical protein
MPILTKVEQLTPELILKYAGDPNHPVALALGSGLRTGDLLAEVYNLVGSPIELTGDEVELAPKKLVTILNVIHGNVYLDHYCLIVQHDGHWYTDEEDLF